MLVSRENAAWFSGLVTQRARATAAAGFLVPFGTDTPWT